MGKTADRQIGLFAFRKSPVSPITREDRGIRIGPSTQKGAIGHVDVQSKYPTSARQGEGRQAAERGSHCPNTQRGGLEEAQNKYTGNVRPFAEEIVDV